MISTKSYIVGIFFPSQFWLRKFSSRKEIHLEEINLHSIRGGTWNSNLYEIHLREFFTVKETENIQGYKWVIQGYKRSFDCAYLPEKLKTHKTTNEGVCPTCIIPPPLHPGSQCLTGLSVSLHSWEKIFTTEDYTRGQLGIAGIYRSQYLLNTNKCWKHAEA